MNRKQFTLLLAVVAAAAIAAYAVYRGRNAGWENAGNENTPVLKFDINSVGEVDITGTGTLNLVNKDGTWIVRQWYDYPANFGKVASLIRTAWELKPTQAVEAGPSQLGRLNLDAPPKGSGMLVEFKDGGGKPLASLLIGKPYLKKTPDMPAEMAGMPAGRYVMANDGNNRVYLVADTLDDFDPTPDRWIKHDFVDVENIESIAVSGSGADGSWQIGRDSAASPWKLLDPKPGETIEPSKLAPFGAILSRATFTDVVAPDKKPADLGLDKPENVAIVTFDGFSYLLKIGKAEGDNFPVEVQVNARIPAERTPGANEKPEDKKRLDDEFQAKRKADEEKLNEEKKLESRVFLVTRSTLDAVLHDRKAITLPYTPAPAMTPTTGSAAHPVAPVPMGTPATTGVTVTTPPVTAPMPSAKPTPKKKH